MEILSIQESQTNVEFTKIRTDEVLTYLEENKINVKKKGCVYDINNRYFHNLTKKGKFIYGQLGAITYIILLEERKVEYMLVIHPGNNYSIGI